MKTVLWIDDSSQEHEAARRMVGSLDGVHLEFASSSEAARAVLENARVDSVVTDILRRRPDGSRSHDDGYLFFRDFIRPNWPALPVIFHTKNLPQSFQLDPHAQYLAKWEPEGKRAIELECRLHEVTALYESFADQTIWSRIEPRLVRVHGELLAKLTSFEDVWKLTPTQFEQLVAELLQKQGFDVLWLPGGRDQGIDIIAGNKSDQILIDVKRYAENRFVGVELVRHVYGVAAKLQEQEPSRQWRGGIITSSRFTSGAEDFRNTVRARPLLRDGNWIRETLSGYIPHRS